MYNAHRGIPPGPAAPSARLAELLEQIRAEFDAQGGRTNERQSYQSKRPAKSGLHAGIWLI